MAKPSRFGRRRFLRLAFAGDRRGAPVSAERILLVVFLRGAADGLSLVVPYTEDRYYALRPTLGVPRPDDKSKDPNKRVIDLDGHFGLHPRMAALLPAWKAGELAIVHAVGSDDETRSHFEAQDRMEHAGAKAQPAASGWLARHLRALPAAGGAGLTAVAIGTSVPASMRGAPSASAVESIASYRLGEGESPAFAEALSQLYGGKGGDTAPLLAAGRETLTVLGRLEAARAGGAPGAGAVYPSHAFGRALREVAALVRAECGLQIAGVDLGSWDSHFVQDTFVPDLIEVLAAGLAAFRADLGDATRRVDVVVMTEFGRRAYENSSFGTDHGRASVMLVLGAGIAGGRVITDWPGLAEDRLEGPGDLAVTIDYRDILAEIVERRLGNEKIAEVFPGFRPTYRGITEQRAK